MSALPDGDREVDPSLPSSTEREHQANSDTELQPLGTSEASIDPYPIIRLIQCPRCLHPLRIPLRLPCNNTICRSCLPPVSKRVGISYPLHEGREDGFTCFWKGKGCGNLSEGELLAEHSVGDCGVDVSVNKIVDVFERVLSDNSGQDVPALQIRWTIGEQDETGPAEKYTEAQTGSTTIRHGRYLGTYMLMKEGRLPYDIKDIWDDLESLGQLSAIEKLDKMILKQLKEAVRNELDCQVCYGLMIDPLTSPCGHTFCRKCVARVLDHSDLCPICRRRMSIPLPLRSAPINEILSGLINNFYPDEISARREAAKDDNVLEGGKTLPLFVCALSFPFVPTFLHVFEPRYRLLIRRAIDDGGGKFGMVIYNYTGRSQGGMGRTQFMQYGTILRIVDVEILPDGRSLLTAVGLTRFKVLDWGMLDGYFIAKTERVDDISLAEEESLEAREMIMASRNNTSSSEGENESAQVSLDALSTQELLQLCLDFVEKQRTEAAPWLHIRVLMAYGEPPTDPARFPYWLASVLPITEEEKYALLPTSSVRERLKMTARWVRKLESMEWSTTSSTCAVL